MATNPSPIPAATLADLRVILPEGREEAHAAIDEMWARLQREARARGEAPPPWDELVTRFLHRCVGAVYPGEG